MGTDYQLVVDIARRIEGYRQRGREQMQQDKRTRFSIEFRSAPSRGRAIQGSSSGYPSHQGQTSGQQSMVPRVCYECGYLGHMKRACPGLQGKAVQQGHQPMIVAPAVRPPKDGGQAGRGRPRVGGQAGGGQPAIVQSGGGQPSGTPARFYVFLAKPDEVASDAVITGDSVVVDRIYRSYVVIFCGYETREDLLLLDMTYFKVILGMDWLSTYHAILDCHAKIVTLAMPKSPRLEWKGSSVSTSSRVIDSVPVV
ncbi:uncharacterized protein [Nicotiana tomentosiformis]|uniref:uncharacterized protein n=1 Tax=Nicotiana tomentosiformis TaxID=4098 RepID=UPI00388C887E